MNPNPDLSGITKYWKPGEDDRELLRRHAGGLPREHVDAFLRGLWNLVSSRRRTRLVGFGAFEWRPWRNRLPTGRFVETWRLAFKPSRYARKFKIAGTPGKQIRGRDKHGDR